MGMALGGALPQAAHATDDTFIAGAGRGTVTVAQGQLMGFRDRGVYTFRGVPYAKATRFMPPQAPDSWSGVRLAMNYGEICPVPDQTTVSTDEQFNAHRYFPQNENCQFLNVWTPSLVNGGKRPVLVFIHGGGFTNGSSIEGEGYDGRNLAELGDLVVVTLNHRLNVLGALDLSAFGPKYAQASNAGMRDIVAALKWINANIAAVRRRSAERDDHGPVGRRRQGPLPDGQPGREGPVRQGHRHERRRLERGLSEGGGHRDRQVHGAEPRPQRQDHRQDRDRAVPDAAGGRREGDEAGREGRPGHGPGLAPDHRRHLHAHRSAGRGLGEVFGRQAAADRQRARGEQHHHPQQQHQVVRRQLGPVERRAGDDQADRALRRKAPRPLRPSGRRPIRATRWRAPMSSPRPTAPARSPRPPSRRRTARRRSICTSTSGTRRCSMASPAPGMCRTCTWRCSTPTASRSPSAAARRPARCRTTSRAPGSTSPATAIPNHPGLPNWPAYTPENGATLLFDDYITVGMNHDKALLDLVTKPN